MRIRATLLLALLPLACRQAPPAPARPALSAEGDRALDILLAAQRFTDDAVGDGGETPPEVIALRALWRERDPGAAFAHLLAHGTLPGRLFALCGIYYADPKGFPAAVEPYRALETSIATQMGCTVAEMPVREIVERKDGVRLASPEQSIREWFASRAPDAPSAHYDIVGGGYPCLFKTGGGW